MRPRIAIAYDAYLDSGQDIHDPTFVRVVRSFSVEDRWWIVRNGRWLLPLRVVGIHRLRWRGQDPPWMRGVVRGFSWVLWGWIPAAPLRWHRPPTHVHEYARFRLGCLEVAVGGHTTREQGFAVGGRIGPLESAERHHWCGMRGRPRDDELRAVRRVLDDPADDLPLHWWAKYTTRRHMIAVLDRWDTITDEERERWGLYRGGVTFDAPGIEPGDHFVFDEPPRVEVSAVIPMRLESLASGDLLPVWVAHQGHEVDVTIRVGSSVLYPDRTEVYGTAVNDVVMQDSGRDPAAVQCIDLEISYPPTEVRYRGLREMASEDRDAPALTLEQLNEAIDSLTDEPDEERYQHD